MFCTKERSLSIGLDNFGMRYYDAELGRFITRDPAGYPDGANNYLYCSNNPVNFIDPLGLDAWYQGWGSGAWQLTKDVAKSVKENVIDAEIEIAVTIAKNPTAITDITAAYVKEATVGNVERGVEAYKAKVEQTVDRISTQIEGGASWTWATANAGAMLVGDVTGATDIAEGASGTGLDDGSQLSGIDRASKIMGGAGKAILAGVALGQTYDPSATFKGSVNQTIDKAKTLVDDIKGKNDTNKPYSNSRPNYGKDQVDNVWENAKQADGKIYDPNTGDELVWDKSKSRNGQWDMGHKPGKEYRKLYKDYMDGKITKDEFIKEYRNPDNYQPESVGSNRSRKFEED